MGNWFRHFIHHYSDIVWPLTHLTGKVPWQWTNEEQDVLDKLKEALSTEPILGIPNEEDIYQLEVDASKFATGGVLLQKQGEKWKVIAY